MKKIFCLTIIFLCCISTVRAAEISIPELKAGKGQTVDVPVMIDEVDNLAGIKLVMKYDPEILEFKKADKTKETESLMHVVNSKNPGTLIVVMAGAKGIQGKNFSVVRLTFDVKNDQKKSTQIEITEVQLMSDQLKDLPYTVKISPITIGTDEKPVISNSPARKKSQKKK